MAEMGGGAAACTRGPTVSVVIDLVAYRADTPRAIWLIGNLAISVSATAL